MKVMVEPSDAERSEWPAATADYVSALEARVQRLEAVARRVEAWWLGNAMHRFDGAPECIFALREAVEPETGK